LAVGMDSSSVASPMSAEQSNTSVPIGDRAILKLLRRLEEGIDPGVELGRYLGERSSFDHAPAIGGSIEYRSTGPRASPITLAVLEEFVPNEGNGWEYVVDALSHTLEELLAHREAPELLDHPPRHLLGTDIERLEPGHILIGPHREWASLLGRRTAELHAALSAELDDPAFMPEPLTDLDRRSLYHGARSLTRHVLRQVGSLRSESPTVHLVVDRGAEILDRLQTITAQAMDLVRIRCHGDYHLGQTLWTGKDFTIIDFEGEPARSIARRRLKRPTAADLAGMIRSFHYAAIVAGQQVARNLATSRSEPSDLDHWLTLWYRWVSVFFLDAYVQTSGVVPYLPSDRGQFGHLLDFFLLEKAVYELNYEANSRPEWVEIPAKGILEILDTPT
jgi:maltose alpha-D-glucosyltransferase/alpha-amylase